MNKIKIFDTTLRDGEQAPQSQMTPEQKMSLFKKIELSGVDIIEIGIPAASEMDFNTCSQIIHTKRKETNIALFVRSSISDIQKAYECTKGYSLDTIYLNILATGSDIHLKHKRNFTREQGLQETIQSIRYAYSLGFKSLSIIIEDASRGDMEYLKNLCIQFSNENVEVICLADTLGCATMAETAKMLQEIRTVTPVNTEIAFHGHNDLGLVVANTYTAILNGASQVHTTICGIGERAGNCSLEELIALIHYHGEKSTIFHNIHIPNLIDACHSLYSILPKFYAIHKPILGENVFSTTAGIHQDGLLKNRSTYEYVKAEDFGQKIHMPVSRFSSKKLLEKIALKPQLVL